MPVNSAQDTTVPQPQPSQQPQQQPVNIQDFMDNQGEEEDEGDIILESDQQSDTSDQRDLKSILSTFQLDNLDEFTTLPVIARRKFVLRGAVATVSKPYFGWYKKPCVEFVGETAADYGGPTREFFRLLMIEVTASLGIFEGSPGRMLFTYDLQALAGRKYFLAGKLMAWSIIHNGPGLRCLQPAVYRLMCGQPLDVQNFDLASLEEDARSCVEQIQNCSSEDELQALKSSRGDWIADCGVPAIYSARISDLPMVSQRIVEHFIFHRVASMIGQFKEGMNSIGRLFDLICLYWRQFEPLFTSNSEKLSRQAVIRLFEEVRSDDGHIRYDEEEKTLYLYHDWLVAIQEGTVDITFEGLLVFVTGADTVPPLGFLVPCKIAFFDQEQGERRMPYASTCSLTLTLPRGMEDEDQFKDMMNKAIRGSLGFGKV